MIHQNKNKQTASGAPIAAKFPRKRRPTERRVQVSPLISLLQSIFASDAKGREILALPRKALFQKPSQEAIDAYEMEVVQPVREGNVTRMKELLAAGKSFDACNKFGESLLHMACRRGDLATVKFLVFEANVNVRVVDDFGRTALHDAVWTPTPNLEIMGTLLQVVHPSMILAEDVRGHTPFQYARKEHHTQWAEFLEEKRNLLLEKISACCI